MSTLLLVLHLSVFAEGWILDSGVEGDERFDVLPGIDAGLEIFQDFELGLRVLSVGKATQIAGGLRWYFAAGEWRPYVHLRGGRLIGITKVAEDVTTLGGALGLRWVLDPVELHAEAGAFNMGGDLLYTPSLGAGWRF